jgi:ferrochelatase
VDKLEENGYAPNWLLAYQSRSGPPSQSWLEPDVLDCLRDLAAQNKKNVVIHPIGFVSDHMEIIFDLDTQAKELAQELGLNMLRTKTAGTTKEFVEMICDLVAERLDSSCVPKALGPMPVLPENCPVACCLK